MDRGRWTVGTMHLWSWDAQVPEESVLSRLFVGGVVWGPDCWWRRGHPKTVPCSPLRHFRKAREATIFSFFNPGRLAISWHIWVANQTSELTISHETKRPMVSGPQAPSCPLSRTQKQQLRGTAPEAVGGSAMGLPGLPSPGYVFTWTSFFGAVHRRLGGQYRGFSYTPYPVSQYTQ